MYKNSLLFCAIVTSFVWSAMIPDLVPFKADVVDQFTELPVGLRQKRIHIIQRVFVEFRRFLPGALPEFVAFHPGTADDALLFDKLLRLFLRV